MRDSDKYSREELRRIADGDEDAFTGVYNRYRDRVYGFAYRMLGTGSIAEEITQEAFLTLIKHPERYDQEKGSMLTFLCAVTRNLTLSHFKNRGRLFEEHYEEHDLTATNGEADLLLASPDPLSTLLKQELAERINECIGRLPELLREAIILREFQELSYEEISIITGASLNAVKVRIYRARQILAGQLAPYLNSRRESCYELRRN